MQSKFENRDSKILDADWEVLPPEEKRKRAALEPVFKWIAYIMDEVVRVPGTKFRFGLDPLLGLIPGIGDTSSAVVSAFGVSAALEICVTPAIPPNTTSAAAAARIRRSGPRRVAARREPDLRM